LELFLNLLRNKDRDEGEELGLTLLNEGKDLIRDLLLGNLVLLLREKQTASVFSDDACSGVGGLK
jgi:hypothetical protein